MRLPSTFANTDDHELSYVSNKMKTIQRQLKIIERFLFVRGTCDMHIKSEKVDVDFISKTKTVDDVDKLASLDQLDDLSITDLCGDFTSMGEAKCNTNDAIMSIFDGNNESCFDIVRGIFDGDTMTGFGNDQGFIDRRLFALDRSFDIDYDDTQLTVEINVLDEFVPENSYLSELDAFMQE